MKAGSASALLLALAVMAAAPTASADETPSYAGKDADLMRLDNGVVIEGHDIETPDGFTSGFRLIAGYSPFRLPRLDLAAEISYRESDEVPTRLRSEERRAG